MKLAALDRAIEKVKGKDVLVSFSGGKDSWIVLDICSRYAKRFEAFFMYVVPDLESIQEQMDLAEARYGIKVRHYPHWMRAAYMREGVFCFEKADAPFLAINDIYAVARDDAGIELIGHGAKRADSVWRAQSGAKKFLNGEIVAPLWDWTSRDVMAYLAIRKLPIPPSTNQRVNGIGLDTETICWLYDRYPNDFRKIEEAFPFCGAAVKRREWFDIGPWYDGRKTPSLG